MNPVVTGHGHLGSAYAYNGACFFVFCVSVKVKLTVTLLCVCVHSTWKGRPQNDLYHVG